MSQRKAAAQAISLALPLFACSFLLRIANFGLVFGGGRVRLDNVPQRRNPVPRAF